MNRSLYYCDNKSLSYDIHDIFNIIIDIEKYPEFLPLCSEVVIISKNETTNEIEAILKIKKGFFSYNFKCLIQITRSDKLITINILDYKNSLKNFKCYWALKKMDNLTTNVKFFIDFDINNSIMLFTMKPLFHYQTKLVSKHFMHRIIKLLD